MTFMSLNIHRISNSKISHKNYFNHVEVFLSCGKISATIVTTRPTISWGNDYTYQRLLQTFWKLRAGNYVYCYNQTLQEREQISPVVAIAWDHKLRQLSKLNMEKRLDRTCHSKLYLCSQEVDTTHISLASANIASASICHLSRRATLPLKLKLRPYNLALSILRKSPASSSAPQHFRKKEPKECYVNLIKKEKRMLCHHCNFLSWTINIGHISVPVWKCGGGWAEFCKGLHQPLWPPWVWWWFF